MLGFNIHKKVQADGHSCIHSCLYAQHITNSNELYTHRTYEGLFTKDIKLVVAHKQEERIPVCTKAFLFMYINKSRLKDHKDTAQCSIRGQTYTHTHTTHTKH